LIALGIQTQNLDRLGWLLEANPPIGTIFDVFGSD